ncbi:MAG: aspartate-semialdehyde dehydrogenase [Sphingobacteriia bacterium]|nr:aspartate-semialdehyde dehydrogenase [Sphingobacteriia bacterium]
MSKFNVAVIGATGVVGGEVLNILADRNFPVDNIYAVASRDSVGKEVSFGDEKILKIKPLDDFDFSKVEIAFFAAGGERSKHYAPIATKAKAVVIDKSSYFRLDKDVPLIIPEVNLEKLEDFEKTRIIANPNCVVIPMAVALKPLHEKAKIKRIVVSTYQSVSGAGREAMNELFNQTRAKLMYQENQRKVLPREIAFNLFPHVGKFVDSGDTDEEVKIIKEINKVLGEDIKVAVTCVRVPVFVGHSVAINVEFEEKITASEAKKIFANANGVTLMDDFTISRYATPLDAVNDDNILVSRIREDKSVKNGLNLWVVGDNLRKGAALNAVQIAEELIKEYI